MLSARPRLFAVALVLAFGLVAGAQDKKEKVPATIKIFIPENPTKVILNGQACGDVSSDLGSNVEIVLGCGTIVQ